jgi:hypothetical protein
MATTAHRLQQLQEKLVVPQEQDGTPATLTALLPCEPAIGEVAVACWVDSAGGELLELVRLDSGERVEGDVVALRESLTLLAMVETLEELASFEELGPLEQALAGWDPQGELPDEFSRARERAREALTALAAYSPGDEPRVARPQLLDGIGGALRELEQAWELLEQAAELWSDALLGAHPGDEVALERVQSLWRMLAVARRGPLSRPPSAALHDGREAGAAMAAAVTDTHQH